MPFNGSGVFTTYVPGTPFVAGTTISSTTANNVNSDIATGLSTCLLKDGTQTVTANIPMNSFKLTGLAAATLAGDALSFGGAATVTTLTSTGNTILGDASGDTLTVNPNAVTWANAPTHSNNHTFSGSVQSVAHRTAANSVSAPDATPTALVNLGANTGLYLVHAYVSSGAAANYSAAVLVGSAGLDIRIMDTWNSALLVLTQSGTSIVVTQTSGGPATVAYSTIRIL